MDLNWEKYDIEVKNDDAIKRNRIFFDFMQLIIFAKKKSFDRYDHNKSTEVAECSGN